MSASAHRGTPRYPLELIVWLDHCEPHSENAWWSVTDVAKSKPVTVTSVGWTIKETKTFLVSVPQITCNGFTGQPLVVIKSCIINRQALGENQ